jgi:hypothetical protein
MDLLSWRFDLLGGLYNWYSGSGMWPDRNYKWTSFYAVNAYL